MELGTSTSAGINDFILSVLIVSSDIVFKWVPAAVKVITGDRLSIISPDAGLEIVSGLEDLSTNAGDSVSNIPQVAVDSTLHSVSGGPETLPSDGLISSEVGSDTVTVASDIFQTAWSIFAPLSIFISLLFAVALVYILVRIFQTRFAEAKALKELEQPDLTQVPASVIEGGIQLPTGPAHAENVFKKRWDRIESQIASTEENEWRLAILEADIMLDEILESNGYIGDTIGEKLKTANRGDFKTLDLAWDAHKMRNHIAHRGSSHDINHREAKRVISEFKQVFSEFKVL